MNDTFTWEELGVAPVAVGDPITVAALLGLYFDLVQRVDVSGWHGLWIVTLAANEGRTWIRGHHDADTEQGAALLAAYALLK